MFSTVEETYELVNEMFGETFHISNVDYIGDENFVRYSLTLTRDNCVPTQREAVAMVDSLISLGDTEGFFVSKVEPTYYGHEMCGVRAVLEFGLSERV